MDPPAAPSAEAISALVGHKTPEASTVGLCCPERWTATSRSATARPTTRCCAPPWAPDRPYR